MDDVSAAHLGFNAFDMDGVVTRTAELHASAWKELFDHGAPPSLPAMNVVAAVVAFLVVLAGGRLAALMMERPAWTAAYRSAARCWRAG